ncbi:CBS domain-containing protein [Comamonas terrae]|uniref:HPP family protein n=1 Tax=Comamonas terrae TaxID=673548 RepID=A0ABW5ULD4_9BURK|nr:CBS domain-containing protein [Comamonas terrae]
MFFVFGPNGQMVRNAAPHLSPVGAIRHTDRPQALRTRAGGPDSGAASGMGGTARNFRQALDRADGNAAAPDADSPRPPAAGQGAVNAYLSTTKSLHPERRPLQHVADVMSVRPVAVEPDTVVNNAWQQLAEHGVAQAPVLNKQGRVIGLLLRADMAPLDLLPEPGAIAQAIALARRPVREVMLSPVPAVSPDTDLRRVASALLDTGLPGLPVTDESGALIGFVSRSDILQAVAADPPLDLWS